MRVLIFLGFIPLAWFGGNVVFGVLVDGSWVPAALHLLPDSLFEAVMLTFLWACRICIFLALALTLLERRMA
jgi:hypothetical protein